MRWFTGLCVLLMSAGQVQAEPKSESGNSMLAECKAFVENKNNIQAAYCLGAVGALRSIRLFLQSDFASCLNGEVTNGQAVRVVVKFMEEHPAMLNEPFSVLTLLAFREAWPCKK